MDKKKSVIICLIIAAFFLYLVASQLAETIFDGLNIAINRDFGLTIPEFIGIAVAGLAFAVVAKSATSMGFFTDVANEMTKVVYPTPKESGQSAVVVIIMVGIATVLLAVFDLAWSSLTRFVLSVGVV
jgi:preprotein translocase SecE subunit